MNLNFFKSSVGKKTIMAITGACLALFLLTHLLGNLLIFAGPNSLNIYAHKLTSSPLIYIAEFFLALIFIIHITTGVLLTLENWRARPEPYAVKVHTGKGATWASSTMPYTGALILLALIIHLINFKFGTHYATQVEGLGEIRDFKRLLTEFYASSVNAFSYIVAIMIVALHVSHGAWSLFQSLGLNNDKVQPLLKKMALFFAITLFVLYSAIPLITYFLANKN